MKALSNHGHSRHVAAIGRTSSNRFLPYSSHNYLSPLRWALGGVNPNTVLHAVLRRLRQLVAPTTVLSLVRRNASGWRVLSWP